MHIHLLCTNYLLAHHRRKIRRKRIKI